MESRATPRDDDDRANKCAWQICQRAGWSGEWAESRTICSSIRGSRVTVYCRLIRVSLRTGQDNGHKLIGELAAGLHLQSTIAFMTLLMSRGRAERGREKDRGRVQRGEGSGTTLTLIDSATNAQHGKCIIYLWATPLVTLPCPALTKMRLISRHTQRAVPLQPPSSLRPFHYCHRLPWFFAFINCLTCPLI